MLSYTAVLLLKLAHFLFSLPPFGTVLGILPPGSPKFPLLFNSRLSCHSISCWNRSALFTVPHTDPAFLPVLARLTSKPRFSSSAAISSLDSDVSSPRPILLRSMRSGLQRATLLANCASVCFCTRGLSSLCFLFFSSPRPSPSCACRAAASGCCHSTCQYAALTVLQIQFQV